MKENKYSSYITGQDSSNLKDGRDFSCDIRHSKNKTPCIVIKGFTSVHHFLSWFQIKTTQPLIFPADQGRSIRVLHDCIIICGFSDLEDLLTWFGGDDFQRLPVTPIIRSHKP
jgi:hypothetical protein